MIVCSNCGEENPPKFRLCGFCGTPLQQAAPAQEFRKVVSILFCDLKGSTALTESLDPEAMHEVKNRYFEVMSAAITRHGGTIEKYIGDAVMAVFGVPKVHEDDAIRAVRAAEGMQQGLHELNEELERTYGVTLANRIGVNTGDVVAGDATTNQRLVTGDAVNVAARLEQAAGDTQTLIGELTYKLVADAVEVEEVEPLELKGKSERVPAFRLVRTLAVEAHAPHTEHALVGRRQELGELLTMLDEVVEQAAPRSVLVLGEAGVGKTRLLDELVEEASTRALVLRGRCLSYGEGITFWPLVEALRHAAGVGESDDAAAALGKIRDFVGGDDAIVERVASVLGLSGTTFPVAEIFWGFRRLFQVISARQPVLLLIEDVHWAESTLQDLLVTLTEGSVLVVSAARTEVLEKRPELEEARTIRLERLGAVETASMIEEWLGGPLDAAGLARVVDASSGNPLFAQQLVSMLRDDNLIVRDGRGWKLAAVPEGWMPPTIHALLSARIDRLEPADRGVLDPASVIGHIFPLAAVTELAEGIAAEDVTPRADELVRTQFLARAAVEHGFDRRAFHHIFIRDSVYESLLKRQRATLHEKFVGWADRVNGDRAVEYEEILGYHLEQAHRFLSELAPADEHARALGADAGRRLRSAGRRAFVRGDMPAAANLLRRALGVLPNDAPERYAIAPDLGEALMQLGDFETAEAIVATAEEHAFNAGVPELAGGSWIVKQLIRLLAGAGEDWADEARGVAEGVINAAAGHDPASVARAHRLLAYVDAKGCQYGAAAASFGKAVEAARAAGDIRQERRASTGWAQMSAYGPTPVEEALVRCADATDRVAGDRHAEALILCFSGHLEAMRGEFGLARDLVHRAGARLEELGLKVEAAAVVLETSRIETLAGDPAAAERELRRGDVVLAEIGEQYLRSTLVGLLAHSLWAQSRLVEAEEATILAEELSDLDDIDAQVTWRSARAKVFGTQGRHDEAEELVRGAVELIEPTDAVVMKIAAFADAGIVLNMRGLPDAAEFFERAIELARAKRSDVELNRLLGVVAQAAHA